MSTIMLAEYAKFINGKLHTCDISEENIINAKAFTSEFKEFINFYINDSVNFLENFNQKIDFLYLNLRRTRPCKSFRTSIKGGKGFFRETSKKFTYSFR